VFLRTAKKSNDGVVTPEDDRLVVCGVKDSVPKVPSPPLLLFYFLTCSLKWYI